MKHTVESICASNSFHPVTHIIYEDPEEKLAIRVCIDEKGCWFETVNLYDFPNIKVEGPACKSLKKAVEQYNLLLGETSEVGD